MSSIIGVVGLILAAMIVIVKGYTIYLDVIGLKQVKSYLKDHGYQFLGHKEFSAHNRVEFLASGQKHSAKYRLRLFESKIIWVDGEPSEKVKGK